MLLVSDKAWKKKPFWLHRLSSSAGLVGKPRPQKFSSTKHCNFSIRKRWGEPLKASNSSTGVVCCPKHVWCQCKSLRPGERNWNQDRKHQIAFHWEQLQMLTSRSLFWGWWGLSGRRWKCCAWQLVGEVTNKERTFDNVIALTLCDQYFVHFWSLYLQE